jgi:hypothetical protein
MIAARSERTRARRVLFTWLALLDPKVKLDEKFQPAGGYHCSLKVDEVKTAHTHTFIEKRQADGQAASSINRELTIIAAMLNQAGEIFAELEQWKKPKIPKLKMARSRRERLVEAGLDYDTIGMITGHKAKELIAHYTHKHPQSVARAAAALEQIGVRRDSDPQKS